MASRAGIALQLKEAAANYFFRYHYSCTYELGLTAWGRRRADLVASKINGNIVLVEAKSCVADFVSDCKWTEYIKYADKTYLAFTEKTWADLKAKDMLDRIPVGVGVLVLDSKSGYMKAVRKATNNVLSSETRLKVLARLAWRHGDLSKRVTRNRKRVFV